MGFVDAVKSVLSNYANFNGRARRSEYWYFFLFNFIVGAVLSVLQQVTGLGLLGAVSGIFSLAMLVPSLAVAWRRMHDIGKSGAFWFFNFIPVVGSIIFIIFAAKDSEAGDNQYGPNPKN